MEKRVIANLYPRCPFSKQDVEKILEKKRNYALNFWKRWSRWKRVRDCFMPLINLFVKLLNKLEKDPIKQDFTLLDYQVDKLYTQLFKEFPDYLTWFRWYTYTDSIYFISQHDTVTESEYALGSDEWNEYKEIEHQLIYVQKLSYDSPQWQAIIEKYRRKDDTATDLSSVESVSTLMNPTEKQEENLKSD